ncbi:MAG TPA: DUF1707 domain-containing protein [Streptosporangiaceae bacterium]|nr:DUF1707 domain-containing protein [Streptosporangiaceae bacterium]
MTSRQAPRDLRASDTDRERVIALLAEAAGDGRLTLGEHSERAERACSARTLGELAVLTSDLAAATAQPIRLDTRRPVAGIFGRERRDGRWVVPDRLAVTAIFGEVVLDLREALLQSSRVTVLATVMGGTVQLIVPDGIAVEVTGTAMLSRKSGQASRQFADPPASPGTPVIEVRALALGGRVKVVRPRRSRWRDALTRRRS